jgi:hypothetical protein
MSSTRMRARVRRSSPSTIKHTRSPRVAASLERLRQNVSHGAAMLLIMNEDNDIDLALESSAALARPPRAGQRLSGRGDPHHHRAPGRQLRHDLSQGAGILHPVTRHHLCGPVLDRERAPACALEIQA